MLRNSIENSCVYARVTIIKSSNIILAGISKITISDYYLICGINFFPTLKVKERTMVFPAFKYFNEEDIPT